MVIKSKPLKLTAKEEAFYAGFDKQSFDIDPVGPTKALKARIFELEAEVGRLRQFEWMYKELCK